MRREKWEQQHHLRISFCFLNSLPALPQPHPLIFPSQFAFISRALPPNNHIPSTSFFNASLPQPLPQPLPPSHLPSLFILPLLSLRPLSSLGVSLFFCPSVFPPFWAFDRSFRNHILKRILDITNPQRTLTVCGWTSASFFRMCFVLTAFFIAATDGPFYLAFVFTPCALECVFLQLPISRTTRRVNIRPFRHRLLISGALLSVIVIQGQGMSPPFVTSGAVSSFVVSFIVLSLAVPCYFKRTHALQATKVVKYSDGRRSAPSVIWLGRE